MLLVGQAAPPPPPPPVADWPALPPLPWRVAPVLSPDVTVFVAGEVARGRCVATSAGRLSLELIVAVHDGPAVVSIPRSIGCPSVEQYTAGLVDSLVRNNLRHTPPGWYRLTVSFTLPAPPPPR